MVLDFPVKMGILKSLSSFFSRLRLSGSQTTGAIFENESLQFWKVYFDFSYYLLLVPFRFSWKSGSYATSSNKLQKIFGVFTCVLTGAYFLMKLRYMYSAKATENPTKYFELAYYFCDTIYQIIIFLLFSKKRKDVEKVFQELQQSNGIYSNNPFGHVKTRFITKILCSLCFVTVFLHVLEVLKNENWDIAAYINFYQNDTKKVILVAFGLAEHNISISNSHPAIVSITALSILSNLIEKMLNSYSDMLFVVTCLMFHSLSKQFCTSLNDSTTLNSMHVIEHYHWLKLTTEKINQSMSIITASFVVGNLAFYATNILDVYKDPNVFKRLRYLCYCAYFFPTLFLAAKSCRDIEDIKRWICYEKNYSAINPAKLSVFLQEINYQSICISSFGCLNVNYSLVGSIVSIIFTYALLKTQFQGVSANLST